MIHYTLIAARLLIFRRGNYTVGKAVLGDYAVSVTSADVSWYMYSLNRTSHLNSAMYTAAASVIAQDILP